MARLVCGYDIGPDGQATPLDAPPEDLAPTPGPGAAWRWLHFEVQGLDDWTQTHLSEIAAETLSQAETRPRCDRFPEGLAINLRGVNLNPDSRAEDMVSLRMWATETLVVTARLRRLMTIDAIRRNYAAGVGPPTPGLFIDEVSEGLIARAETVAAEIEDETNRVEELSLTDHSLKSDDIVGQRRAVIMLRRFVAPQRDALMRLATLDGTFITADEKIRLRESANRAMRLAETLEALRERQIILQEQITARRADRMGRNSYILSVVAAIFLPLGFATGLFGVNVAGMPGVEWPGAFAALTAAMIAVGVGLLLVFRWKRWL